ncbi:MAG: AtpZ/AtpI family protein [Pseudomonadota bacterium]
MSFGSFLAASLALCITFISRIAFCTLIGYYIDKFLGTSPWVMIFFIGLGAYLGWIALIKVRIPKDPND